MRFTRKVFKVPQKFLSFQYKNITLSTSQVQQTFYLWMLFLHDNKNKLRKEHVKHLRIFGDQRVLFVIRYSSVKRF